MNNEIDFTNCPLTARTFGGANCSKIRIICKRQFNLRIFSYQF